MTWRRNQLLGLASLAATSALGCIDPDARFDQFKDDCSSSDAGICKVRAALKCEAGATFPTAEQANGRYILAITTNLTPNAPMVLSVDFTATETADGLHISATGSTLAYWDRTTPVGESNSVIVQFDVPSSGEYAIHVPADPPIPADANPLIAAPVSADTTLSGTLCVYGNDVEYTSGIVSGEMFAPIKGNIDGEFGLHRADFESPTYSPSDDVLVGPDRRKTDIPPKR